MDEFQNLPLSSPSPSNRPQRGLWIFFAVMALLCVLIVVVGIPVAGVVYVGRQNDNANSTATANADAQRAADAILSQPPEGWDKRVGDVFLSNVNKWDLEPYDNPNFHAAIAIEDGRYLFSVERLADDILYFERPGVIFTHRAEELFLAVEARQIGGSSFSNSYGLVFRDRDEQGYSLFEIRENGYFSVETFDGEDWSIQIPWTREDSIHRGEYNRLVIVTDRGDYVFLINDKQVGRAESLSIEPGTVSIFIGGATEDGVDYEFDNFQLYEP